ncbi:MAG: DNA (cytosine-5-)-methyltransferase [Escherichia coli]|nr:DNA (cytosine-5-)-methyltransferase [Escherichia coli]
MDKTICELFAGVGGFRVGFEKDSSKWKTIWANQWEPSRKSQDAFEVYDYHFPNSENINISISDITDEQFSKMDADMIVGGFPCQDYSVARSKKNEKGIEGKKGVLFWEIIRATEIIKPKYLILENVDRLLKAPSKQRGRDFAIMLTAFNNLGYSVEWRVINAADYGFQQRRRRTFIFATHESTKYCKYLKELNPYDYLKNKGFFSSIFSVEDFNSDNIKDINLEEKYNSDTLTISDSFSFSFENSGFYNNGIIYTVNTTPNQILTNTQITLEDILEKSVDEKYILSEDDFKKWEYLKGPKAIERTSKTGHKYIFREGGIAFPDPINKPARTMLTSEGSKNRSTHVVRDLETGKLRLLTPIECERINGFPDNWTNSGMTHSFRYFTMGNALVVNLITHMAHKLHEIIDLED